MLRIASAALALCLASLALAAPPTDEAIQAYIEKVKNAGADAPTPRAKRRAQSELADAELAKINFAEASIAQVAKLIDADLMATSPQLASALNNRAEQEWKAESLDGARWAEWRFAFYSAPPGVQKPRSELVRETIDRYKQALQHPKMAEYLASNQGGEHVTSFIVRVPDAIIKGEGVLDMLKPLVTDQIAIRAAGGLVSLVEIVASDTLNVPASERQEWLDRVVSVAQAALTKPADDALNLDWAKRNAEIAIKAANGPWARGTLLGNPAPELEFEWTSDANLPKKLSELKGKVVVLHFWATPVGQSIQTFQALGALQSHYAKFPVVILGVTSVQGFHLKRIPFQRPERIDTANDPQKEFSLMPEFMRENAMTWPVAFSKETVMNTAYGVRWLPHVAIIDAEGVVRHNALAMFDASAESQKIDELLKAAKLPVPETPIPKPEMPKIEPAPAGPPVNQAPTPPVNAPAGPPLPPGSQPPAPPAPPPAPGTATNP